MENENISAKGLLHTKITKSARERYATGLPSPCVYPPWDRPSPKDGI